MKHEKTFAAIDKLKDVELELHRLKNALEMANRALDAQRPWVGLTYAQFLEAARLAETGNYLVAFQRIQQWLQELNT
jgi:predicted Zn-dependent protease